MQIPTSKTPIARCETASLYTQQALRRYAVLFADTPEQAAALDQLADTLRSATAPLLAAQANYRAAVIAQVGARVGLQLVDLRADRVVRSCLRAAQDAGSGVAGATFPGGVTPIVRPVGQTEVDQLHALEARVAAQTGWSQSAEQHARLVAVRTAYEEALRERTDAALRAGAERAVRDTAREDFLDVFASVAGALRQLFPRDRKTLSVFAEPSRDSRSARSRSEAPVDDGSADDETPDDED